MYELYPYFTNDGTVGLFSRQDDDIYHSTFGALTESWQKFIIPAHLEQYMAEHDEVSILDICYGIGYNTKTALNLFVKQALAKKNNFSSNGQNKIRKNIILNKFSNLENNDTQNKSKFSKNNQTSSSLVAAIGTDNISRDEKSNFKNKKLKDLNFNQNNCTLSSISNATIDADNICDKNCVTIDENKYLGKKFNTSLTKTEDQNMSCQKILIDAVDLDETLMKLSPFVTGASRWKTLLEKDYQGPGENVIKYQEIKNIKRPKKFLPKEFRLKKEVPIILLIKMLEQNPALLNDENLQSILSNIKYSLYISKYMKDFAKFCSNQRYKTNKELNKTALLHNIYYRYLSRSYKKACKLLNYNKIDVNFHKNDARDFVKASDKTYNFIFLDAFTPAKCPALWSVQFFGELYGKLKDDGMILTYSNSAAIRNAFLKNDFYVGKIYDPETKKFVGTVATKNIKLIEHELDELDLELVHSKAGICYFDKTLNTDNDTIIKNRDEEFSQSTLASSTRIMKGHKNGKSL